jgi:hypothetical protein
MKKNLYTKKIYWTLCLGIIFSASLLRAQLNGVYTIDNTVPVSTTNFTSFTQFASTLNLQGVSGPVTVNVGVTSGPYTEQIEIIQYAGASATNSVVVNGNGRTITFNATNTALRHTIMLSGADYMTWNNLRVIGTNATSALVVHLWNASDNNTFNNMYIEAPFNGTSSTQVPFSISGSSVSPTTSGNSGSMNIVNTCTMIGGYYNTVFYGNFSNPLNTGNEVRNSVLRDFYMYGFYNVYCVSSKVVRNLVDRQNRTTLTSTYGIYLTTGSMNSLVEGNRIRDLFITSIGNGSLAYPIYVVVDATAAQPNLIRNNVISDINSNGTIYGVYLNGADFAHTEHNTISLDYSLSTSGTAYGIYNTGGNNKIRNNNISVNRGGTGAKYGLYYTTTAINTISDYNNVYVGTTSGTYGFAYLNQTFSTLATWQAGTGYDMNSVSADPQYANPGGYDYSPTNLAVNNKGLAIGVLTDVNNVSRSPLAPDPGAYEIFNSPCTSAPPTNSFAVPTSSICPYELVEMTLQNTNTYTNSGYVVQWYSSPYVIGGYSAIAGSTLNSYATNQINTNLYFQAVVTCSYTNQSNTTTPQYVQVVPPVIDTVPYFESFESLAQNGLPNCYWSASNHKSNTYATATPGSGNRAPRTGNGYAYFDNKVYSNYFYSNQILLKTGITYSAALWYITDNGGYSPWADLSISFGTNQSPVGLNQIASKSPVTGQLYNLLSNTFSVATTGYYNIAVRATGSLGAAPYLAWDDLSITIPCSLNSPTLHLLAPMTPVCQGMPATLQAGGANTYTWSNGVEGSVNVVTPLTHSTYIVYGRDTLSGCSTSAAINVSITPSPVVGAIASNYSVCSGQSSTLSATGANSYYWSSGTSGPVSVVSPTISTTYQVAGTNSAGCTASAQVMVQVSAPPIIIAKASNSLICQGEAVQLTVSGADTYLWLASNLYSTASLINLTPQSSTIYTVTGTTLNGCSVTSQVVVVVEACTGLAKNTRRDFNIFPNPAADQLFIQTDGADAAITISDVSGRVIATTSASSELTAIDLTNYSAGVYYVRLQTNNYSRTEKFIRQ